MVFASLLHSAFIGYLLKRASILERAKCINNPVLSSNGYAESGNVTAVDSPSFLMNGQHDDKPPLMKSVTRCDIASRIIFPVIFTAFNLLYWIYYLNAYDEVSGDSDWITNVLTENKTVDIRTLH